MNEDHGNNQDQLEHHSLPGTNQAGKGPEPSEDNQKNRPDGEEPQGQDHLEAHSLPGTNQAGNVRGDRNVRRADAGRNSNPDSETNARGPVPD
jgi:hypothetical protein